MYSWLKRIVVELSVSFLIGLCDIEMLQVFMGYDWAMALLD